MGYISTCNHPESTLTGSTANTMINRAKDLGMTHFAITDNGYLVSVLKSYDLCLKKGIKPIAGVEIFFRDNNCDIIANTQSDQIKYFKLIVHAKDQDAYQKIVKTSSNYTKSILVNENTYPLWDWNDLQELSTYNVTISTSNTQCMISKHLFVGRPDLGMAYYQKLKNMFGDRFYPALVPIKFDKYWNSMVRISYMDGRQVEIPANSRVSIVGENKARAYKIARLVESKKPCVLTHVVINNIMHSISERYQNIANATLTNDFSPISEGDVQLKANKFVHALASRFGDLDRLLINTYSFYANEDDRVVQNMKLGEELRFDQPMHMQTTQEIRDYFTSTMGFNNEQIDKMIANSHTWASEFNDFKLKYKYRLIDSGDNTKQQIIDTIKSVGRMQWDNPLYTQQMDDELELLTNNGVLDLAPYFLPLISVFQEYENEGLLTGPGRGSAGGFLLSYLMGITHVDPIVYGLSSSRFLTKDRVEQGSLPDIDCDLEERILLVGKDGGSGYLNKTYGNQVAQASTRTMLRLKSAILDANRFVNKGEVESSVQELSKSLPATPQGIEDKDFVFGYENDDGSHVIGLLETNRSLQEYASSRPEEWNIVVKALSMPRQNSRHACAFLIADVPIEDVVPIFEVGGVKRVTQPVYKDCEKAGLVKYDFLIINALRDIRIAINKINDRNGDVGLKTGHFMHNGVNTYIWDLPHDPNVFDMLGRGETETIFQLNTTSVTPFVKQIKPKNILECATTTSLVRPGPLDFVDPSTGRNMVQEFVERKYGRSQSDISILEELIPETYGVLVFQEQVTHIAKTLGRMSIVDSENVRIAMGKKKIREMNALKPKFIEGAIQSVEQEVAEKIWAMMETFARYGFNKSHAVAYSFISYACAFLKHHYPLEWWASILSNADDKDVKEIYYKYTKDMVLPPDINLSNENIIIDYEQRKLRNKLSIIAGLGVKAANKIIEARPYVDIKDFIEKKPCGPSLAQKLILVGVLDSLFKEEKTFLSKMQKYEDTCKLVEWEQNIASKISELESLEGSGNTKKINSLNKSIDKLKMDGPKKGVIDPKFMCGHVKEFLMKKHVFPTMNLDLHKIVTKEGRNGTYKIGMSNNKPILWEDAMRFYPLVTGDGVQVLDSMEVPEHVKEVTIACAGYVVSMEKFSYKKNTKTALKILIDSSGYISEKVIWENRETGLLDYPPELAKGCMAYFVYNKNSKYNGTSIRKILIEHEAIKF